MVGKKSGKAQLREEGLARTDNNLDLTTWPVVNMINQKNYYTDYLKRDDQFLAYRSQNEEARNRMVQQARDKDRALAQTSNADVMDTSTADVAAAAADGAEEEEDEEESEPEAVGSKLVVIHLGSQNMRIGFGSDALPKTVPMVIARKWKESESEEDGGEPRPKRKRTDDEGASLPPEEWFGEEFAAQFTNMTAELKTRMRTNKRRVLPNSKELVVNFNRRTTPETIHEHNDPQRIEWTEIPADPAKAPDYLTGHAALRIPDDSKPRYKLFWPIRYGWFNEKDYSSKNHLYIDLALIMEQAIRRELGITKRKDLAQYDCVFIIPDLYERVYVTALLDILVRDLGFGRVCFQQESLSATFGAGYSSACVVDIGAQKTSVCCVEEGMCIEDSRVNIKLGGADVTDTFIRMMLFDHFPYEDINLRRRYDWLLAEELKQKYCTMQEQDINVQLYEFHLRVAGQDTRKYQFKTFDEPMLAPMGYFKPSIFDHSDKLVGRRTLIDRSYDLYDGSPNDPLSAAELAIYEAAASQGTVVNGTAPAEPTPAVTSTPMRQQPLNLLSRLNDAEANTSRSSIAGSPGPDGTPQPGRETPLGDAPETTAHKVFQHDPTLEKVRAAEARDRVLPVLPLDEAILTSIAQGARGDDRKTRDFLGGIMLIGGGGKIAGFAAFLEERLRLLRPGFQKEILIGPPPRELDPQVLVWKGGSVFGKLSANGNDSWINQMEYDMLGSRLLVHKCMFPW